MADDQKPKNKGGRPRKHPVGSRVPTLAFRVRAGLRDKLEQSAGDKELSISEELERRIEESFQIDVQVGKIFGNRRNYARIAAILEAMDQAEKVEHGVLKNEDDRECLKTIAAIRALGLYADHYSFNNADRRSRIEDLISAEESNNKLVSNALLRVDPFYAMWSRESDTGTKDDINKPATEIRQDPATLIELEVQPRTRRKRT